MSDRSENASSRGDTQGPEETMDRGIRYVREEAAVEITFRPGTASGLLFLSLSLSPSGLLFPLLQ
ncbi:hypothetical protein PROFUN_00149 [Planoprotostelium fungivorum]|uniref:Uncharacterized protein n=1 Tax=Planoprotostelium fungivorum TaxID=1890364 RepID=A0A2P6P0T7_9EUKA|nr:hypothetical protein PROFUN_00149 [Planoprotostelium fungivorum]